MTVKAQSLPVGTSISDVPVPSLPVRLTHDARTAPTASIPSDMLDWFESLSTRAPTALTCGGPETTTHKHTTHKHAAHKHAAHKHKGHH